MVCGGARPDRQPGAETSRPARRWAPSGRTNGDGPTAPAARPCPVDCGRDTRAGRTSGLCRRSGREERGEGAVGPEPDQHLVRTPHVELFARKRGDSARRASSVRTKNTISGCADVSLSEAKQHQCRPWRTQISTDWVDLRRLVHRQTPRLREHSDPQSPQPLCGKCRALQLGRTRSVMQSPVAPSPGWPAEQPTTPILVMPRDGPLLKCGSIMSHLPVMGGPNGLWAVEKQGPIPRE